MSYKPIMWCLKQRKGIRIIEPNDNISKNYLRQAKGDFDMVQKSNPKWKIVTAYYSCYNSIYAILMKIGIKCEIHDCTISLMDILGFNQKDIEFIRALKKERIAVQYYLEEVSLSLDNKNILKFLNTCKEIMRDFNDDRINEVRAKLKNLI